MNRLLLVFFAVVLLAARSTPVRAATQAYIAGRTDVAVDGTWVGIARSMSGGDPRGTVIIQKPNGTAQKKSIGSVAYAPIVLEMDLPLSPVLLSWITDFCANKTTSKTVLLTTSGATGSNATTLQAVNTTLSEVRIPTIDAASKDAMRVTFVFSPEYTNTGGTPPTPGTVVTKQASSQNFRFTLTGLTTTKVSKIQAFTLKLSDPASAAGELRDYAKESGVVNFPNLVLTIGGVVTDWNAWRQDFIINGNNGDAAEKSGTIELLSADLKTTLFALQLSNVGLVRVTPSATEATENIGRVEAELYVESMTTAAPAGKTFTPNIPKKGDAAGDKGSDSGKTDPTNGTTDPTRPTESSKPDDPSVTTAPSSGAPERADPTKPNSDPSLASTDGQKGDPITDESGKSGQSEKADPTKPITDPSLASEGGKKDDPSLASDGSKKNDPTSATADNSGAQAGAGSTKSGSDPTQVATDEKKGDATVNTVDPSKATERSDPTKSTTDPTLTSPTSKKTSQAAHDIIDFPKPENAVRKAYNVYRGTNSTQETASYTSKSSLADTVAFYANGLEAAGWSESSRMENNDVAGNQTQVVMHWAKKLRAASITIYQQKDGGVVINISETTSTK